MLAAKRRKISNDQSLPTASPQSDNDAASVGASSSDVPSGSEASSSPDTEDEIAEAKRAKSKKTLKRKRRATDVTQFGATLQSLLSTDAPSGLPLSLKPSVSRKRNDEKLEMQGRKILQVEKKEKEEKGRIRDVIGGWGGEGERVLRKVAQRGVVRLFNAIQHTQAASSVAADEAKAQRGSGKPTLPAPKIGKERSSKRGKEKDFIVGREKELSIGQDDFFDILKSGGIVSKS
ncbi:uncharacterized protein FIBRA_00276 [Fibroporia radiculosa]|uniref:Rrp15p-domain-containing protein n=1 Tax=Fibroporia radiculosa TaxID=599839 RepID=J7RGS7_9APHY|nr:uncharacterized protein FIBRA_00276 [Fibroporia radiculosa]CCL98282.1 predicted protein [Fibroporia radiculosa]